MEPKATHFSEDELASMAIARVQKEGINRPESDHLHTCQVCSGKLDFFLEFYTHLADELQQRHDAGVASFGEERNNEVVIPFSVFQPFANSSPERFGDSELILAAKEKSNSSDRYRTVATFSSANPSAILRVLEDRREHRYKVFILSEFSEIRNRVRVALTDDDGRTFTATTNEDGMASIAVPEGFDWAHSHIAVSAMISNNRSSTTS